MLETKSQTNEYVKLQMKSDSIHENSRSISLKGNLEDGREIA